MRRRLRLQQHRLSSSTVARTIVGLAVPLHESVDLGLERPVRFSAGSITFERENVPLLAWHDPAQPVGRLIDSAWTEDGLVCTFRVSRTQLGDEILQLANDSVLGLSIGVDVPNGLTDDGTYLWANEASMFECSVTPVPMFAGASISSVTLSREGSTMEDEVEVTFAEGDVVVNINDSLGAVSQTVVDSMASEEDGASEEAAPAPVAASLSRARVQPVARAVTRRAAATHPYPHLLGGRSNGRSWFRDMQLQRGMVSPRAEDAGYQDRLSTLLRFASTANLPASEPPNAPGVIPPPPDPGNPLSGVVTTRSLPSDGGGPFYVVSASNTGEANLSQPHVEGVEPILGDIGVYTRQLVTPSSYSAKAAATREAVLSNAVDIEATIFNRMAVARNKDIETNLATLLDGATLPAGHVYTAGGTNVSDDLMTISLDLLYMEDSERFDTAIVSRNLFADIVNAKGTDGRPLFPILGATNTMGTTEPSLRWVNVHGINYYPVSGLTTGGYILDKEAVVSYAGPVLEFTMDYEIAWVRYGVFGFLGSAILDLSGVIRLNYSAA